MLFTLYLLSLPFAAVFVLFYSLYVYVLNSDCPDAQVEKFFSFLNFVEMFLSILSWPIMLAIVIFMDYIYPYVSEKITTKYREIQTRLNKITRYNFLMESCCHCGRSYITGSKWRFVKTRYSLILCEDCLSDLYHETFPKKQRAGRKSS